MTVLVSAAETLDLLRTRRPLVHCITNGVTAALVANVLLAVGAVPAMVESSDEVEDFVGRAGALAVNLGTLTPTRMEAIRLAVAAAARAGVPWVLDPVAAGSMPSRAAHARALLTQGPAVVRGNASEVPALLPVPFGAVVQPSGRGPDASATVDAALPAARVLASTGPVVAITGAVDQVVHRRGVLSVHAGHPLMALLSGAGCAATAVLAACLAVQADASLAAACGLAILGAAGGLAAAHATGPGSFAAALLDALHLLDAPLLAQFSVIMQSS